MNETLRANGENGRERNPDSPVLGLDQMALFEPQMPGWLEFLRRLIDSAAGRKLLGPAIYPNQDADDAADNLGLVLRGKSGKYFHVGWLDHIAREFGAEGEEAIVRYVCERYGYAMPVRKPDPVREEERQAAALRALVGVRQQLDAIEASLRGNR